MPLAEPGAAVSPGVSNCIFARAPGFTVIDELVFAVFVPSVKSLAVTVALPEALSVTEKVLVPLTSAAFAGRTALVSEEVIRTVSATVLMRFQVASTALTVTLNAVPAVCALGVPVFPLALPGAAVSPGSSTWSCEKEEPVTAKTVLVALVKPLALCTKSAPSLIGPETFSSALTCP